MIDTAALLIWFDLNERPLPWRNKTTSAWGILISEVMSQQTPVARVAPQWQEWIERWPTPADFAKASKAEVLRAWGKLGYPRRALRLHECAQAIVERHDGAVPSNVDELLALPGIGAYTARAVACFHFQQDVPVVDTNVRRVYGRAVTGQFLQPQSSAKELGQVAEVTTGPRCSAALMELGALVCTAKSPKCDICPIRHTCQWQKLGCPQPSEEDLSKAKKRVQKFTGTDRQVRGLLMDVLRAADDPVEKSRLDVVWPDAAQRSRALFSLVEDGLAVQTDAGKFHLPQ
ncbi:A/G-specific adenine glycosylase [Corynebacterium casei]|uniref:A/G-specific adenine glycosylase n=2 Tax=Corynebacterium casei TaxID=160386 RepID=UPI002646FFA4|nr:A/G-specific adenine glycosylase [Corynebacterium casei]MDN5901910.1 A/G-specific adenine glycosylase [Corynebacterium casei]MDN6627491.1 A/G-specific adenine glycosylase [Corynebacterium casei]MDN6672864.1 A/G-specific adenine glycosylase [Corynebacterium casei]